MLKRNLIIIAALLPVAPVYAQAFHAEPITAAAVLDANSLSMPSSKTITVQFPNRSATFTPSLSDIAMLADAHNAALIIVRGRTSTPFASAKDEMLSLTRAMSARKYLLDHGVSPIKVHINYVSAADFIAENITPEGKALNQRVEIELVYAVASVN